MVVVGRARGSLPSAATLRLWAGPGAGDGLTCCPSVPAVRLYPVAFQTCSVALARPGFCLAPTRRLRRARRALPVPPPWASTLTVSVSRLFAAFYTSKYGYKMCLRVYLNGDGTGRGTHLSLFFVVMKGPNDALLRWPFNQKVGLGLSPLSQQSASGFAPTYASRRGEEGGARRSVCRCPGDSPERAAGQGRSGSSRRAAALGESERSSRLNSGRAKDVVASRCSWCSRGVSSSGRPCWTLGVCGRLEAERHSAGAEEGAAFPGRDSSPGADGRPAAGAEPLVGCQSVRQPRAATRKFPGTGPEGGWFCRTSPGCCSLLTPLTASHWLAGACCGCGRSASGTFQVTGLRFHVLPFPRR